MKENIKAKLLELGQDPTDLNSIHKWLLNQKIFVDVRPIDDWDTWTYVILAEDIMQPLYEIKPSPESQWGNYDNALLAGIEHAVSDFFIYCNVELQLLFYKDTGKFYCEEVAFVPIDKMNGSNLETAIFRDFKGLIETMHCQVTSKSSGHYFNRLYSPTNKN